MVKVFLLVLLSLLTTRAISQEAPKISLSAPFTATNCYKSRLIQCSNGNTFLINFKKNGCDFLLFDQSRKMIKRGPLTGRLAGAGTANDSYVSNIFETDTTLSFFLSQKLAGKPAMFRIVVNARTGAVINEQKIAELSKPKSGSGWAQIFGKVHADINVVNDPATGCYALIAFDGFTEDTAARLHVDLYNAKHEQLWSNAYTKLAPEHKYVEYMAVAIKNDKLYLCTHEWTTRSYGQEESILVMTEISAQGKIFRQRKLDLTPGLKDVSVNLLYAPSAKRIMLCLNDRDGTFKQNFERYKTTIAAIREDDFSIDYSKELNLAALDEDSRKNCSKRKDFGGSFNDWMLDEQGNPRILLSEFLTATVSSKSAYSNLTAHSSTVTEIGDIGIIQLDKNGNQVSGYVVAHAEVSGSTLRPRIMNHSSVPGCGFGEEPKPLYEDLASDEFTSCNYIHTPAKDYVIYNIDRKEITQSLCDGIAGNNGNRSPAALYTITNGVQKRDYLFEPPVGDDLYRSAVMKSADYAPGTKTYAVVMTEQHEKKMISHIAWMQF